MLIFDDQNQAIILDNVETPVLTENYWVLDLQIMDYTLAQLMVLEEIIAPTVELDIRGFKFLLPLNWNILVVDQETQQIDIVVLKKVAGRDFTAFIYGPDKSRHESSRISVTNFYPNHHNVGPSLMKNQMMCHPIDAESWINVAPSDGYNKYLKDKVAGDIL